MLYSVGEFSELTGVSAETIRYYDNNGLLPFAERSKGGARRFKESDVSWLRLVECLKKSGMQIREIQYFIDCCLRGDDTVGERLLLLRNRCRIVERQIEELKATLELLEYRCWYYETSQNTGPFKLNNRFPLEKIPERFRELFLSGKS